MSYTKKEKLEISPEKSKEILTQVLAKEENKICADCLSKGMSCIFCECLV